MPAGGFTDRTEMYHPDDTMKSATLDLKDRHRGRGGSVPFAADEDVDPQYFPREGEVSSAYAGESSLFCSSLCQPEYLRRH